MSKMTDEQFRSRLAMRDEARKDSRKALETLTRLISQIDDDLLRQDIMRAAQAYAAAESVRAEAAEALRAEGAGVMW